MMVAVAQLVRASDCGPEGRRFDPGQPPTKNTFLLECVFLLIPTIYKYMKNNILKNKKSKTYKNLGFLWVLRDSNP